MSKAPIPSDADAGAAAAAAAAAPVAAASSVADVGGAESGRAAVDGVADGGDCSDGHDDGDGGDRGDDGDASDVRDRRDVDDDGGDGCVIGVESAGDGAEEADAINLYTVANTQEQEQSLCTQPQDADAVGGVSSSPAIAARSASGEPPCTPAPTASTASASVPKPASFAALPDDLANCSDDWKHYFVLLSAYRIEHGTCHVPNRFTRNTNGTKGLAEWVTKQRKSKDVLEEAQVRHLTLLGLWEGKQSKRSTEVRICFRLHKTQLSSHNFILSFHKKYLSNQQAKQPASNPSSKKVPPRKHPATPPSPARSPNRESARLKKLQKQLAKKKQV